MLQKLFSKKVTQNKVKTLIAKLKKEILQRSSPNKIYLFGSIARNQLKECSDIDVAIILDEQSNLKEVRQCFNDMSAKIKWPLDILIYNENMFLKKKDLGGICQIIFEDGKLIWEKS